MEITMKDILEEFNYCNVFSLTSSLPIKSIPTSDKAKLLKQNLINEKQYLLEYYQNFAKKEKIDIDFELLFSDIIKECETFYTKIKDKNFKNLCGQKNSPFICDYVGKNTKYSKPLNLIWHFYHNIQNALMANDNLLNIPEIDLFQSSAIFNDKDNVLKNNFIKYEYTFSSHCTKGPLQLVLYFKLNNETKNWLLQFKNDYDLANTNFEDLAIYNNDKIKFSSCTHEKFNSLGSNMF